MAVGHTSARQRAELLEGLLRRGDAEAGNREKLHLLAFASLETAPELDSEPRRRIEKRAGRMLPPKSVDMAQSFASAGSYVLDRLATSDPKDVNETGATIRAAAETGLDEVLTVIARFGQDERQPVQDELLRDWSRFDTRDYARLTMRWMWVMPWAAKNARARWTNPIAVRAFSFGRASV